jgi:hypothetical protein
MKRKSEAENKVLLEDLRTKPDLPPIIVPPLELES